MRAVSSKDLNTQAYVELVKTDANAKREAVVTYIMQLSDSDAKVFWPIYREYDKELSQLNVAEAQEIEAYAKDYDKITDKQADRRKAGRGAAIGALGGGTASVLTRGEQVHIPAETILEFRLQQPASLPRS